MEYKLIKTILVALVIMPLLRGKFAMAQYYQSGNENKSIVVDKKIKTVNGDFVDNIYAKDKVFYQDETVEYQIVVKNSGAVTLSDITLLDKVPSSLSILDDVNYNAQNSEWKIKIDGINPGETKEFYLKAKLGSIITSSNIKNYVEVSTAGASDSDEATIFANKSTVPETGFADIVPALFALSGIGAGIKLRKLARGY